MAERARVGPIGLSTSCRRAMGNAASSEEAAGADAPVDRLSTIFTGDLVGYRDAFVFSAPDRPWVPAVDLLRADSFDRIVDPFAARYSGADRRAVVSFWTQWYFGTLIPPAVAAILLLERDLPLALEDVGVILHEEEYRPTGFRLPHRGQRLAADVDPFERFQRLVRLHLEPLIDAVAANNGLATRLLWSNAGSYFDWIVRELASRDAEDSGADAASEGFRLLNSVTGPDGSKNPLFRPVRPVRKGDEEVLQRRICCLRYLLPGVEACGDRCPLPA